VTFSRREEKHMREAKFTKSVTAAITPELYDRIKEITDRERISMAEWFRGVAERALIESNNREEAHHDRPTIYQE
jgi:hypothetical protein